MMMMEELSEGQCQENTATDEKPKRRFKSRAQLQGLEDYFNEHKYPTESMKADQAEKLGLTEKQVSGWFCHRRLKDKRILQEGLQAPGRQDLSSGVIQDHGSGLKQDSCSSTKQADHRLPDLREVESRRFFQGNLPPVELNYHQRRLGVGTEMDDTSSESNSAPQESFYPQSRSPLDLEVAAYRAPNGFIPQSQGRVGPSGYLKIKGQRENAAITAVKRQLGRHYREDGPSLGIEFDPLPPGAFELQNKDTNDDAYLPEPFGPSSFDISGLRKHPGPSTKRNGDSYGAADYRPLHSPDPHNFSYHQPKQQMPFANRRRAFPEEKSSFNVDSYSARESSDYDNNLKYNVHSKHDLPGMRSDSLLNQPPHLYGGKIASEPEDSWWPSHDSVDRKALRREQFSSRPAALAPRHNDSRNKRERMQSSRILMEEELYMEKRPASEHHDSIKLKMPPTNELRTGKRARVEVFQEDYPIRTSSQDPPEWSRQIKGSTEMPSSFSEDETAETSSSMG